MKLMSSKKSRFHQVVQENAEFLSSLGVTELGLFGSVVRGEDGNESDVDVLVRFREGKKSFRSFLALSDFLEEQLGSPVDLVTREGLSRHIGPRVLKETEYVQIAS